jgi:hypothetical protein
MAASKYSGKYNELMPKLKDTDTKMAKEMEHFEDYVNLKKKVDPSLINAIQAELRGITAGSTAEFVTPMESSSVGVMEKIHRWMVTGARILKIELSYPGYLTWVRLPRLDDPKPAS